MGSNPTHGTKNKDTLMFEKQRKSKKRRPAKGKPPSKNINWYHKKEEKAEQERVANYSEWFKKQLEQ